MKIKRRIDKRRAGIVVLVVACVMFVGCMFLCALGMNEAIFWLYLSMPLFLIAVILMRSKHPDVSKEINNQDNHHQEYHE